MHFPISVQRRNRAYVARLLGAPSVQVVRRSRDEAVAALREEIDQRVAQGTLALINVEPVGITELFGRFKDDPALGEICAEAYRRRDADVPK